MSTAQPTFDDILRLFQETDCQFKEIDRRMQETDRRMQETDRQLRELGKQIGGLGAKFDSFTEGFKLKIPEDFQLRAF